MSIEVLPGDALQTSPMVVCLWFYAHGDALMEWWCLAIIIADKEILQNIADISH